MSQRRFQVRICEWHVGEQRYANSIAALLIRFVTVMVEREPLIPAPSTGALWLVVFFILLTGHPAYSTDSKNRVERVSARSEPIRPRCFHALNNHCRRHAAIASTVRPGGELMLADNLVRLKACSHEGTAGCISGTTGPSTGRQGRTLRTVVILTPLTSR
jgi:hypothetical protein